MAPEDLTGRVVDSSIVGLRYAATVPGCRRSARRFRPAHALDLWAALERYKPTLLSGLNPEELSDGAIQKRRWVDRHLGTHVPLITCRSRHKRQYGRPGDVLVDDWAKWRHLWERMGGVFVLHTSAQSSLAAIREHLGGD